jgi:type II secretory pathway component PulC
VGLRRAEVDAVLDAGIPRFLSSVETAPAMAEGRFLGFRVLSFFPGDARFASGPILRGDVVTAVNGLPIERPEHLFRVWQELRVASSLTVDVLRQGQTRRMTWVIE